MDPSSPDVKRPSRNLISTPGPNPIQLRSLYMTKDSACPLSSLMACTRSTGQEAGKINVHKTKRSITETERGKMSERHRRQRQRKKRIKWNKKSKRATLYYCVSWGEEEPSVSLNETAPETEFLSWGSSTRILQCYILCICSGIQIIFSNSPM